MTPSASSSRTPCRSPIVGTVLCVALGFPMAYLITTRLHGFWRYTAIAAVVVPYWMPFLLRTYSLRVLLGDTGPLATALHRPDGFGVVDTLAGAQLGVVYNYLPLAVLPICVALDRLDTSLRQAGRDLGASSWRVFWQVTLPAARPGVVSGALLVFIPLMGDYVTPLVLGGVKAAVVGSLISDSFLESQDWALGAAAAVLLILLVAVVLAAVWLTWLLARALLRLVRPLDITARVRSGLGADRWVLRSSSRDGWGLALRVYGLCLGVVMWAPILTVVVSSSTAARRCRSGPAGAPAGRRIEATTRS